MPTPSFNFALTRSSGPEPKNSVSTAAASGTTDESTTVRQRQPRKVRRNAAGSMSRVGSLREAPSFSREESANFVKELLLSTSRKSAGELKVGAS